MDRIASIILFTTVAAAPLPFGSTDPVSIAFWCIVLGIGLVAASPKRLRREHFLLLGLALFVILAFAFVLHEQLAPRPWFAPPNELWRQASDLLGTPIAPAVSIARNQPFFSIGAPLADMLAIMCSFIVCMDRERARQLLLIIAWSGAAYAAYGIAALLIDPTHVFWREKTAYRDVLTSTFINRNTAAAYFGSCAILWLLFLSQEIRALSPSAPLLWRSVLRQLFLRMPRSVSVPLAMLILCSAGFLMTNSRAGIVLSFVSLIIAFATVFRHDVPRRGGGAVIILISVVTALLLLQVFGGRVSGRFDVQGLSDEGRLDVYRSTLKMIADNPWFGTGLGTFAWGFPAFRSANISMWGVWDRAHSTPLELASDLGLPLAGIIILAWLIILIVLIRGIAIRRRDLMVPIAGFAVAILSLAHSTIDFSLQIPGYAIVVFAIVGAGLAQSFSSNNKNYT